MAEKLKFYKTPYGFHEAEYKGCTITYSYGDYYPKGYSVNIGGDILAVHSAEEAQRVIDETIKYRN